jgi:hypothetical protein
MTTSITIPIPLHIELRCLGYDENDRFIHRVRFGVVGVAAPASVVIADDLYVNPVISRCESLGGIELARPDFERLALACFKGAGAYASDLDGSCAAWTISDVAAWIHHVFPGAAAEYLLHQMRRQVTPGLKVGNRVIVGDDAI